MHTPLITRLLLSISLCLLFINQAAAQPGCPAIDLGPDIDVDCNVDCIDLTADVFETGNTESYAVSSIPYDPVTTYTGGTSIIIGTDDVWSSVLNLPFDFCFFGNTFDQLIIGSNGVLSFEIGDANGFCAYSYSASLPSNLLFENTIFGAYHDIDPTAGDGGNINYKILGAYPCRIFVINFSEVNHFSCNNLETTQQIVLYETTNVIEVYLKDKPTCNSWNSGNALIGIQNDDGTLAYAPPGRNTGNWSAFNEAWRFTPDGAPNYEVNWYQNGNFLSQGTEYTACPAAYPATYLAEIKYEHCDGSFVTETDEITITSSSIYNLTVNPEQVTICEGETTTLNAAGSVNYSWSPELGLSSTMGQAVIADPTQSTTYTVSTIFPDGCEAEANIDVIVSELPDPAISVSGLCLGSPTQLTGSNLNVSTNVVGWLWNYGDGGGLEVGTANETYNYPNDGPYTVSLTATTANGCTAESTQSFIIFAPNDPSFHTNNSCIDAMGPFLEIDGDSGGVFSFNPVPNDSAYIDPVSGNLSNLSGNKTYFIEYSFNNSCPSQEINPIDIYALPTPDFVFDGTCLTEDILFYDLSLAPNGAIITSSDWSFGDGNFSNEIAPTHYYTNTGTYTASLTITTDQGCSNSISYPVEIAPLPVAAFDAAPICENIPPMQFNDQSFGANITNWQWIFGDGNTSSSSNPAHSYNEAGNFYTTLSVTTDKGCTDSTSKFVEVYPGPSGSIFAANRASCYELCTDLQFVGANIIKWDWNVNNMFRSDTSNPALCLTEEQLYDVEVTVTNDFGCIDTFKRDNYLEVYVSPVANFNYMEDPIDYYNSLNMPFYDQSEHAATVFYSLGDGTFSEDRNPIHTYEVEGTYSVFQAVESKDGCKDTMEAKIDITPNFACFIPNSFTPNGDGLNDVFNFRGYAYNPEHFELYIINRWGDIIHHTKDISEGWDGLTHNKKKAVQDVYQYIVLIESFDGTPHEFRGNVTLFR